MSYSHTLKHCGSWQLGSLGFLLQLKSVVTSHILWELAYPR